MGQKISVGPFNKGLRNDRTAFSIDNDSFPILRNAYQWRGRIKRKRGTTQLTRLKRYFDSNVTSYNLGSATQVLNASGEGNLITGFSGSGIQANASIVPGTVSIVDTTTATTYTDPSQDGTLSPGGTINYATGDFTISPAAADTVRASFSYFPNIPVMGLDEFINSLSAFPSEVSFDTTYAYNINTTFPNTTFSISFYKNLATGAFTGYTQKTNWTSLKWNGQDYQQFWITNYQNAFWATNGVNVPFSTTNIGMQYKLVTSGGAVVVSGTDVDFTTTTNHPFVEGDFVFANEFTSIVGLNFQTGFVLSSPAPTATTLRVRFPSATISGGPGNGGILQALTTNCQPDISSTVATSVKDCLRIYDGLPITPGNVFTVGKGWVNFCPPLSLGDFSISDLPADQYYLVGAKMVQQFKDRIVFFGPVVQTSAVGSQRYLKDSIIYSQNGTPYYTASFPYTGGDNPTPSTFVTASFTPVLLPENQTSTPAAFFEDLIGYGGSIQSGFDSALKTISTNEDVIIAGFESRKTRLVYTGNDLIPFNFYTINTELPSSSTFSAISMDRGMLDIGPNGIALTSQEAAQRVDLEIPDEIFQFNLLQSGFERVCAQRDFINEWVYFTYPSADGSDYFPNQTLLYNYRENTWAIFRETYTTYGTFRRASGQNWDDLTNFTWDEWEEPWDSGEQTLEQPEVIAGNAQGFVMMRDEGTGEEPSSYIQNIAGSVVTSPHHSLDDGDYIIISGALGTVGSQVNGKIFSIKWIDENSFSLNPSITGGTYFGLGVFTRMYIPYIQTKQFPVAWDMARKTRLGVQMYLLTATDVGRITLMIFLSQNGASPYNTGPIVPDPSSTNNTLIYSTVLYTCPESTNLGLTPANVNLQMPTAQQQAQIWHRMNTSLIGDTVQIGFTLNDEQMRDTDFKSQFKEIELHGFVIDVYPGPLLC